MKLATKLFLLLMLFSAYVSASEGEAFFIEQVEPILRQRCYECHSHAGEISGGLVLDSRSGWQTGGDSGPALVPGTLEKSLLIAAVRYANSDLAMPPKEKLPASEIAILEQWVSAGAIDPREMATRAKKTGIDIESGRKHWAYQPVRDIMPPPVGDKNWPLNDVDAFILAKQEQEGLKPTIDADAHSWLRRVSLDLTGLPPTETEINDFIADKSLQAHERVVDRLLSSMAYGERWARHWLDIVGYAEQIGTEGKIFAEHAWRYRDYLIESFNSDKPFDRFIREQVAGDLLPATSPQERRVNLIATGFIVLGDVDINAIDKLKMEYDFVDSQVSKIGTAFLGMTLGCVRCHDHKFDAISQHDYYALAGMFRSTKTTFKTRHGIWSNVNRVPLPELDEDRELALAHDQKLAEWRQEKDRLAQLKASSESDDAESKKRRDELNKQITALESRIAHGEYFHPGKPQALAVQDVEKPADMRLTIRGNPYALGDVIPRGLVPVAMWGPQPTISAQESGRRELAEWIADARNPLTARVAVNRMWQKLFGEGLVRSVDYFGTRGDAPSHPELLDHLAHRFVHEGWSQKRLLRTLVLSRTYRLSSADNNNSTLDPENILLTRMNRQRLDAESIRDAMLVASGCLAAPSGGPGLPLEFPENISGLPITEKSNHPQFALSKERESQTVERTLYLPVVRTGTQPGTARVRDVFDFPQPAQFTGKRSETTVPTQALYLLNADHIRHRGEDMAKVLLASDSSDAERVERLWLRVLSRPVTAAEQVDALVFVNESRAKGEAFAWTELARALFGTNEFLLRF